VIGFGLGEGLESRSAMIRGQELARALQLGCDFVSPRNLLRIGSHIWSSRHLRTFQIGPKDLWQAECAGPRAAPILEARIMSEPAGGERQSRASDVVWVVFYSILVLLFMLLWTSAPA
jgi:hypothetical protein